MYMKAQNRFMKTIKKDVVFKPYSKFYGEEAIKIYQFIIKKKRNGLINEACIDYLRDGEYWYY